MSIRYTADIQPAIAVRDLDAQVAFYTRVLGFEHHSTIDVPPEMSARASISQHGYRITRLLNSRGDMLKLVRPGKLESEMRQRGSALMKPNDTFLTFIVEDLQPVLEAAQTSGTPIMSDGIVEVRPGVELLFLRDPEGNFLEFVRAPV